MEITRSLSPPVAILEITLVFANENFARARNKKTPVPNHRVSLTRQFERVFAFVSDNKAAAHIGLSQSEPTHAPRQHITHLQKNKLTNQPTNQYCILYRHSQQYFWFVQARKKIAARHKAKRAAISLPCDDSCYFISVIITPIKTMNAANNPASTT